MPEAEALRLFKAGDFKASEEEALKFLEIAPENPAGFALLGHARLKLGRVKEAAQSFLRYTELRPDDPKGFFNCGLALENSGDSKAAHAKYAVALKLDPAYAAARNNLAEILSRAGELSSAEALCREGLAISPDELDLRCALGNVLNDQGRLHEAVAEYEQVVAACRGYTVAASNIILSKLYLDDVPEEELLAAHKAWAAALEAQTPPAPRNLETPKGRRLRIGYLSPDFKRHSVAFFIEPVLAHHDKSRFEVFCYSDVSKPDAITSRLSGLPEHWRNVFGVSADELERLIRADDLDVLFDLAGHTGSRIGLFARRLARVQIAWIGYAATSGLSSMDFRITDALADPPGNEAFHTESLLRLPGCFLVFSPPDDAPPLGEAACARNGFVTFGSFNALPKMRPSCVKLWASVLKAVPGSRLLLKNKGLIDAGVRARILAAFEAEGVAADRLELRRYQSGFASHLGVYSQVDIALDSFPYNGTTTTCEALWMGVPTITLVGRPHRARVGLSLMSAAGLGCLAASSPEAFVEIAKGLASDIPRLVAFKSSLRNAMAASPLCDAASFTTRLERKLERLFRVGSS